MLSLLYRAAAVWTGIGLTSGLFYREFTKLNGVDGGTQLAVVHTHTLTLGTLVMLVLLALVGAFPALQDDRWLRRGYWVWQAGLVLTAGGLLVKGMLQVLDNPIATSPAIAGVSGLGHMTLTAGFILFFVGLAQITRGTAAAGPTPSSAQDPVPSR